MSAINWEVLDKTRFKFLWGQISAAVLVITVVCSRGLSEHTHLPLARLAVIEYGGWVKIVIWSKLS